MRLGTGVAGWRPWGEHGNATEAGYARQSGATASNGMGHTLDRRRPACMTQLIVKSAVRDHLDDTNVAADCFDALDEEVGDGSEEAVRRADANDRKTVQRHDF